MLSGGGSVPSASVVDDQSSLDPSPRATRLSRWLTSYGSTHSLITSVSLQDPARRKSASSLTSNLSRLVVGSPTTFTVVTKDPQDERLDKWVVDRTLGDFCTLREILTGRFPGATVPLLPETHASDMFHKSSHSASKQSDTLQYFVKAIARHPFMSQDDAFLAFLSPVGNSFKEALEAMRKVASGAGGPIPEVKSSMGFIRLPGGSSKRRSSSLGMSSPLIDGTAPPNDPVSASDWWLEACDLAYAPADPETLAKDVLVELDATEKGLQGLKDSLRNLTEKRSAVGEGHVDVAKAIRSWEAVEHSPHAPKVLLPTVGDAIQNVTLPQTLQRAAQAHEKHGDSQEKFSQSAVMALTGAIRSEILLLRAFRVSVTAAKDKMLKLKQAEKELEHKIHELKTIEESRLIRTNNNGTPTASEDKSEHHETDDKRTRQARKMRDEAIRARDAAKRSAAAVARSVLSLELGYYREERIVRTDAFFREYALEEDDFSREAVKLWGIASSVDPSALTIAEAEAPISPQTVQKERLGRFEAAASFLTRSGIDLNGDRQAHHRPEGRSSSASIAEDTVSHVASSFVDESLLASTSVSSPDAAEFLRGSDVLESGSWPLNEARVVRVAFDFEAGESDELTCFEGQTGVAEPIDDSWLLVTLNVETNEAIEARTGLVPANFMSVDTKPSKARPRKLEWELKKENARLKSELKAKEQALSSAIEAIETTKIVAQEEARMQWEDALRERDDEIARMENLISPPTAEVLSSSEPPPLPRQVSSRSPSPSSRHHHHHHHHHLEEEPVAVAYHDTREETEEDDETLPSVEVHQPSSISESHNREDPSTLSAATTINASNSDLGGDTQEQQQQQPVVTNSAGWICSFDPKYKRVFFYNTKTKESTWIRPDSVTADAVAKTVANGGKKGRSSSGNKSSSRHNES